MSRNDAHLPRLMALLLLLLPCLCWAEGLLETRQEWAYGDGLYEGRSMRLGPEEGLYLGGTLGQWRAASITTQIAGVFLGFKTEGEISLDLSVGGYTEIDPTRPHPVEELLPRDLASMGKMALGMALSPNLKLSVGGLYLKEGQGHAPVPATLPVRERFLGQARIDYRFF